MLLCGFNLSAQTSQKISEYGKISQWEADLEIYDHDKDAEAVVLFDIGKTYFFESEGGYDIRYTRKRRVKILKESGLSEAEIQIPYYVDGYGKTEKIASLRAHTINIVETSRSEINELQRTNIYTEKVNERWHVKKFAFPNVKPGSIIEYEFVLESPFLFNMPNWQFQDRIPTIYSEYQCNIIPFYEYVFYAQGIRKFDKQESYVATANRRIGSTKFNDMVYRFAMNDVPAFKDESYITSIDDYIIKLRFQLAKIHRLNGATQEIMTTWPKLKEELLRAEKFGKYIKAADRYNKKHLKAELSLDNKSDLEKVEELVNYVKGNYSWDGYQSKYSNKSINQLIKEKKGNAAALNLYLKSLLTEAGIEARPVILSTRNNGKMKVDYPFSSFFNYVIVLVDVDGKQFFVDATEVNLPYDRIPIRCINEKGLIIDELETAEFASLSNNVSSTTMITLGLQLAQDGKFDVKANIKKTEASAYLYRNKYSDNVEQLKEYYLKQGIEEIGDLETYNYSEKAKPYTISFNGSSNSEAIDDLIVIKPFLGFTMEENPLKQKTRRYPVDMIFKQEETISSVIEYPDGYTTKVLPKNYDLDNKLIKISTKYSKVSDNSIKAFCTMQLKKAVYNPTEYNRIKFYFDQIVKEFNRELVLYKNETLGN